ncbi:MAG TPA: rod shape-determining protein MreC [bacterium]|nr:rod shape-determining protein MreC [bacterium]
MNRKRSYKLLVAFCFFLLLGFLLRKNLANEVVDFSRIVTKPFSTLSEKVEHRLSFVANIRNMKHQNEELAAKLAEFQVDKSKITELENENRLLKQELGFLDSANSGLLIPARIIGRDPTAFLDHIIIDKGSDFGIEKGMAVVVSGVLVGQVDFVNDHTSQILLITSKDSIVQAMLQESRSRGILRGGLSGLYLDNITQDTDSEKGELVVTSGLGGKIKQGILIGRAVNTQNLSGIFKSISVDPAVNLAKLEIIFIQK